ncbi:MAG: SDR family oxidoreductase [SAR324 cluster bacterium]|nr:SDR family oxidoreductase [SAR324 cluster bacterium]
MKGKICIVTGASSGIGQITALELAKLGAHLVMVCRNPEKGEQARLEIIRQSRNKDVELMLADLSSQRSIREMVESFKQKHSQLHLLVNNAGLIMTERQLTEDGLEMTFATNHMGYFLLTTLLLDLLKQSAPARIVNVSSEAHHRGNMDFDNLQGEKYYNYFEAYGRSKLANILFTHELSKRLQGTEVTVNCLHPGVIRTGFGLNTSGLFKWLVKLAGPFLITPEKGAETSIYLASSPEVDGVSGKYFKRKKVATPRRLSQNDNVSKLLWDVSESLIKSMD